ncbi:MAG TPA: Imm49 family immunity protein, partial [Polyangiaceae bacterium]|nr:Imm49 family immunity protein [Polyangiaceae bacterium]
GLEQRKVVADFRSDLILGTPSTDAPGWRVGQIWQARLREGTSDRAALISELERCSSDQAGRWDKQWTHGIALCLLAVEDRDHAGFQRGLEEVASFTQREATRGDWRTQNEGQMSLVGLGLCRAAREAGMRPVSDSAYIPIQLLDEE